MNKITRNNYLFLLIVYYLLLFTSVCFANDENDFQSWSSFTLNHKGLYNTIYSFETHGRFGINASRLSQSILRPSIGYRLNNNRSVWLGYAWIYTTKPFSNPSLNEHRFWQQYLITKDFTKIKLLSRSRLEQRFFETKAKVGWRYRQLLRVQYPISQKLYITSYDEIFLQINDTLSKYNNQGLNQNRLFIGIGTNHIKNWTLELGYQNLYIKRIKQNNFTGNIIITNFSYNN